VIVEKQVQDMDHQKELPDLQGREIDIKSEDSVISTGSTMGMISLKDKDLQEINGDVRNHGEKHVRFHEPIITHKDGLKWSKGIIKSTPKTDMKSRSEYKIHPAHRQTNMTDQKWGAYAIAINDLKRKGSISRVTEPLMKVLIGENKGKEFLETLDRKTRPITDDQDKVIDEADRFVAKWRLKTPHKGCTPFYVYGIGKKNVWYLKLMIERKRHS
jgi:hypothetical protein